MNVRSFLILGLFSLLGSLHPAQALDLYGGGDNGTVFTVDPSDASGMILADPGDAEQVSGLGFSHDGELYATIQPAGTGDSRLVRLNPDTGEIAEVIGTVKEGSTNLRISDLAFLPRTNLLYAAREGTGEIYTINLETAEAGFVGTSCAERIGGITLLANGTLIATGELPGQTRGTIEPAQEALMSIDSFTAQCVDAVPLSNFYDGLAVDPEDENSLYASLENSSAIYRITLPLVTENSIGNAADETSDLVFLQIRQRLLNISGRALIGTGENVAIAGFIIRGEEMNPVVTRGPVNDPPSKRVLLRGIGPSLEVGGMPLTNRLLDPVIELYDENGLLIDSNDNWKDSQEMDIMDTGLAPTADAESALIATLASDENYTAVLRGKNDTTGIGVVEAYDIDPLLGEESRFANISTRAFVQTGDNILIGGFIPGGDRPIRVMVRAIGPSLTASGVINAMQDPVLEVVDANGNSVATNDNWPASPDAPEITASGLAPLDARESAIIFEPGPNQHTALVRGVNNTTGVALAEIYDLGEPGLIE